MRHSKYKNRRRKNKIIQRIYN